MQTLSEKQRRIKCGDSGPYRQRLHHRETIEFFEGYSPNDAESIVQDLSMLYHNPFWLARRAGRIHHAGQVLGYSDPRQLAGIFRVSSRPIGIEANRLETPQTQAIDMSRLGHHDPDLAIGQHIFDARRRMGW